MDSDPVVTAWAVLTALANGVRGVDGSWGDEKFVAQQRIDFKPAAHGVTPWGAESDGAYTGIV